jgi:type II secretory pathway component PulJ
MNNTMKLATTLVELMIAVALMSVVVLGAIAFDAASRKMMGSSERRVAIGNELSLLADYFSRDMYMGHGAPGSPCAWVTSSADNRIISIRQDNLGAPTPNIFTDDTIVTYNFNCTTHVVMRNGEALTNRLASVCNPGFALAATGSSEFQLNGVVLRYRPALATDNATNPQVSDTLRGRCMSSCN